MSSAPKGRAVIEVLLNSNKLNKQLRAVEDNFKRVGGNILKAGAGFTAFGAALVAPLVAATKSFLDFGDTVDKISARTGAGAEFISALGFAAEQSGADIQTLEKAIVGQQRTINDLNQGLATAADSYEVLGLTAKDLVGLGVEDSFTLIAQRLSEVKDPSLRAATALEIFGKAGQKLIPLLNGGEAAIKKYVDQANKAGLVINQEDAKTAADLADALNMAQRALQGLQLKIGASLAKQFTLVIDKITQYIVKAQKFVNENRGLAKSVLQLGSGLIAIGAALSVAGLAFIAAGAAVGSFASIFSFLSSLVITLTTSFLALGSAIGVGLISPLGIAALAITNILLYTTNLGSAISDLGTNAKDDLGGAFLDAKSNFDLLKQAVLAGDLKLAFSILATSIKSFFLKAFNSIIGAYDEWVALTNSGLNNIKVSFQQAFLFIKQLWLRLRLVFSETSDALASAFLKVLPKVQNLFIKVITKIRLLWLDITKLIEGGIKFAEGDVRGAKETFDALLEERARIKAQAEEKIKSNLELSFGDVESNLTKQLKKDIDGISKEIDRLEKGALDFTVAGFEVADDQKAAREAQIKKLEQDLQFLGAVAKQAAEKQQAGAEVQKKGVEEVAKAFKSIVPKFGQLAEAGSSSAIKLFGSSNNPLVKEQKQANKKLDQLILNTNALEVR